MTRERDPDVDLEIDFDEGLRRLDQLLVRLQGPGGGDLPPADLEPGACAQCGAEVRRRWCYGSLALCRTCTRSRVKAGTQVDVEPPLADPIEELAERARTVIEEARGVDSGVVTGSATAKGDPVLPAPQRPTRRFVP